MMPNSFRNRVRRRVLGLMPSWFRSHNFEIFTSILCLFGGIPLLFGQVSPTSLEATLPRTLVLCWGFILSVGPVAVNVGLIKSLDKTSLSDYIFWSRIEAWGLSAIAYAAYIYGGIVAINSPVKGGLAALIIIFLGITCHCRESDIQLKIADVRLSLGLPYAPGR